MLRRLFFFTAAAVCAGQDNGSSTLALRVEPEAWLNISSVPLRFAVPGTATVTATLEAWARPLPGQRVRIVATPAGDLTGSAGRIPVSAVSWSGAKTAARGGGATASCTGGTLAGGGTDLAAGWTRPGTLTCTVAFTLQDAGRYSPGVYSGTLITVLRME